MISGLGALCFAYGRFVEPRWLDVTRHHVVTPALKDGVRIRVVQISDLDISGSNSLLNGLAEEINALRPDLVVFTGDALNDPSAVQVFRNVISSAQASQGRYAVRGTHDIAQGRAGVNLFGGGVATELGSAEPIITSKGRVALCGAPQGAVAQLEECLRNVPEGTFSIVAYHSPELIEKLKVRPDLYLAGQTHGGQVRLPKVGALLMPSHTGRRYQMGRYEVKDTILYVNRGIGLGKESPWPIRFLARPEVAVIDIVGRGK
jgi:predicted MPP superfamily phosphohydrolase